MAISNLRLNVAANTSRALADFGKFSQSLDNKFLVSGLKLDFVRSALSQINRDFTRAIGEQGLASASSLRAAQNQAALLTQTFKGFSVESALAISTNIGTALNNVAVRAGGTMKDVQKTLAATPFISTRIGEDMRQNLTKGMMAFQRDMRRAGLGDNFGGVAQQFLMGRSTGMQLIESGDPMAAFLGSEIVKRAGGEGYVFDPAERSRIMADIVGNKQISEQLELMAKRTYGFRIILEDLNTYLFNPEAGVFGSLRKVVDSAGNTTTMFDEVEKLTESVFGKSGMFAKLVKAIRSVFGDYDPMRPFIDGVQLMRRVFDEIGRYFQTSGFQRIVEVAKDVVDGVTKVFTGLYEQIGSGNFDPDSINEGITSFNESLRDYIKQLGQMIRGEDVSKQSEFTGSVLGTLVEEIGKTSIVLIKELFATFIDKVPEIATKVLPALNDGINKMLTEVFGNELAGKVLKFVLGFVPGPIGQIARASTAGDLTGGGGNILSMLAMGGAALLGPAAAFGLTKGVGRFGYGAVKAGRGMFGPAQARLDFIEDLKGRVSPVEERYNRGVRGLYMPDAQRTPLSGLIDRLRPRTVADFTAREEERFRLAKEQRLKDAYELKVFRRFTEGGDVEYGSPEWVRRYGPSGGGGQRITAATSMFNDPEFSRRYAVTPQTNIFGSPITGSPIASRRRTAGMERPRGFAEKSFDINPTRGIYESSMERRDLIENMREALERNKRVQMESNIRDLISSGEYGGDVRRLSEMDLDEWEKNRNLAHRINRRYGSGGRRAILGRGIRRFGRGALVTGALAGAGALGLGIFGGPGANAQTMEGFNAAGSVLGGGLEGAMTGAAIGSIIPGIGTAAGAVIGGVIGGVAPLMDKGVRDSIGKLIKDISTGFGNTAEWFITGTKENFGRVMDSLGSMFKSFTNGFISVLNIALTGFQILPRVIMGMVEIIYNKTPGLSLIPGLGDAVNAGKSLVNFQIPNFASGKDYAGPAMALEARMSGRRPMVVNDGEFVIPKDGFPILAGLVGQNLRSTGVIGSANNSTPTQVNVTLSLTAHSVVANADELVETMREPVYKIIADAIREAENSRISRTPTA